MYCRSLFVLSQLTRNTSALASSCIVGSHTIQTRPVPHPHSRYLAQHVPNKRSPGRFRRFLRWFGIGSAPVVSTVPPPPPITTMQRVKRTLAIAPPIERFFLRSHIIEDDDLARLISKTAAITIYAMMGVTTLGTLGVDTKPLLAGIGITGFTVGFALKEVATNFISGIFLVINKPFVRGCRIKIHGSGGGIEGLVHYIDIRYVHLKTKDRGLIMVPSAIVYTNPFTVFPADDEANAGFLDMTKPATTDPTKPSPTPPTAPVSKIIGVKDEKLKMKFETQPAGAFQKAAFKEKL